MSYEVLSKILSTLTQSSFSQSSTIHTSLYSLYTVTPNPLSLTQALVPHIDDVVLPMGDIQSGGDLRFRIMQVSVYLSFRGRSPQGQRPFRS